MLPNRKYQHQRDEANPSPDPTPATCIYTGRTDAQPTPDELRRGPSHAKNLNFGGAQAFRMTLYMAERVMAMK